MEQELPARSLYVVALPIGNAADITLRALWLLVPDGRDRRRGYAGDASAARALRHRHAAARPRISTTSAKPRSRLIERLARGERVALVTDAGTPGVSDPGARVVRAVLDAGYRVVPVPGASSAVAAVSAAGLAPATVPLRRLPSDRARGARAALRALAAEASAFVLFEAPHRVRELLALMGDGARADAARRARARTDEEVRDDRSRTAPANWPRSTPTSAASTWCWSTPARKHAADLDAVTRRWLEALLQDLPPARAAAVAARASGQPRDALYRLALQLKPAR